MILDDVGSLVLAQGHEPVADLVSGLSDCHGEVHAIGDRLWPRTVGGAVLEGLKVASSL